MIQPGAAASLGSEDTGSIPQSAFADSSLCTREVRCPDGHTLFAFLHRAGLARQRSMTAQALGPGVVIVSQVSPIPPAAQAATPPLHKGGVFALLHRSGLSSAIGLDCTLAPAG